MIGTGPSTFPERGVLIFNWSWLISGRTYDVWTSDIRQTGVFTGRADTDSAWFDFATQTGATLIKSTDADIYVPPPTR